MYKLDLPFRWIAVMAGAGEAYQYPGKLSKYMRRTYEVPAIYCWRVEKDGRPSCVYIGETEALVRRLRAFLKPGPLLETNLRMQQYMLAEMAAGAEVIFEMLVFPSFEVNGFEVTMEKLGNLHVRKMLESMAILTQTQEGCKVLNAGKDLAQKKKEKFARSIPKMRPTEREKLLKIWAAKAGML